MPLLLCLHALQKCYYCTDNPGGNSDDSCTNLHIPALWLYFFQAKVTWPASYASSWCGNTAIHHDVFEMDNKFTPYWNYEDTYNQLRVDDDCTSLSTYHRWLDYYGFSFGTKLELKATLTCSSGSVAPYSAAAQHAETGNDTSTNSSQGPRAPRWTVSVRAVNPPINASAFSAPVRENPPPAAVAALANEPVAAASSSALLPKIWPPVRPAQGSTQPLVVAVGPEATPQFAPAIIAATVADDGSQVTASPVNMTDEGN